MHLSTTLSALKEEMCICAHDVRAALRPLQKAISCQQCEIKYLLSDSNTQLGCGLGGVPTRGWKLGGGKLSKERSQIFVLAI